MIILQHSPGPWSVVNNDHYFEVHDGSGKQIGDACASLFEGDDETVRNWGRCEANARMMAASFEMVAALKALLPEVDAEIEQRQSGGNAEDWEGLKAISDAGHSAIAKAEGRS